MRERAGRVAEDKTKIDNRSSKFQAMHFYRITFLFVGVGWPSEENFTQNE